MIELFAPVDFESTLTTTLTNTVPQLETPRTQREYPLVKVQDESADGVIPLGRLVVEQLARVLQITDVPWAKYCRAVKLTHVKTKPLKGAAF